MLTNTTPAGFTLWHRTRRFARWRPVGTAPTAAGALDIIGAGGRRNGQWLVRPVGSDPNADAVVERAAAGC